MSEYNEWWDSGVREELYKKFDLLYEQEDELRQEYESNLSELTEAQRENLVKKLAPIYTQYDEIHGEDFFTPLLCDTGCYYTPSR